MAHLTLSFLTKSYVLATVRSEDPPQAVIHSDRVMRTSAKQKGKLANLLRMDTMTLESLIDQVTPTEPITIDLAALVQTAQAQPQNVIVVEPFTVTVRGRTQSAGHGTPFTHTEPQALIREILSHHPVTAHEPLITWQDSKRLAVLDIDYHHGYVPQPAHLELWASQTQPAPLAYHISHGGGVKMYYAQQDYLNADELAAAAAINWRLYEPFGETEICTSSRHPLYPRGDQTCGPVRFLSPTTDLPAVTQWMQTDVPEDQILSWLTENTFERGQRYGHDRCPISPYATASDTPVFVGDVGIHCFICAAKGRTAGYARTPGFVSYAQMLRGSDTTIRSLVRNMTHWEHAKHILKAHLKISDPLLKLGYSALLKIWHGDDERIPQVFHAGSNMLRFSGRWVSADGSTTYSRNITAMIASLPATQFLSDKGPRPNMAIVQEFNELGDLSDRGYPAITPVRGSLLFGVHHQNGSIKYPLAMPNPIYKQCPPTYYRPEDRPSHDEAFGFLTQVYPGMDLQLVKLLAAMKGSIESGHADDPFLFITGPSGSGKSSTAKIVAAIVGDHCAEPTFQANIERFRQAIMAANDEGSFVAVNEFIKLSEEYGLTPVNACNPLLGLTEDSLSHKPYVGAVKLGRPPVLILTDTSSPASLGLDRQIARRLFYHHLIGGRTDWRKSSAAFGLSTFAALRIKYPKECDYIYSHLVDELFSEPVGLTEQAERLGILRLECADYGDGTDINADLIALFEAVCNAPELTEKQKAQYGGKGWKAILQTDTTALREAWELVCDGPAAPQWFESRRCSEADWSKVLNLRSGVACDVARRRGTLYVRFRFGPRHAPAFVNSELKASHLQLTDA